ncbi:polyprotein [Picornaviridae sp.]|nr:polyprotein [Picornaviridae sp.]
MLFSYLSSFKSSSHTFPQAFSKAPSHRVLSWILSQGAPHHRGSYLHATLPYNIYEQDMFDKLCLAVLPGKYRMKPIRQGLTLSRPRGPKFMIVYTNQNPVDGFDVRRVNEGEVLQIGWREDPDGMYRICAVPQIGMEIAETTSQTWWDAVDQLNYRTPFKFSLLNLPPDVRINRHLIQRQGNSTTNIYGNGNSVTTDVGANGWTPTVNTSVGDNPMSSSNQTGGGSGPGIKGGSSTSSKDKVASGNHVGSRYSKWWEPAAARGLERGIEHAINLGDKVIEGAASAVGAGVDALKHKLHKHSPPPAANLLVSLPTSNQAGTTEIQSQAPSAHVIAYPPTEAVVLPSPDAPSVPGPSGDRAWLVDTFQWGTDVPPSQWLAGPNSYDPQPAAYPPKPTGHANGGCYPLPWALVTAQPQCVWSAMYSNHSYWNAGFRVQLTVNGSQFHSGCLVLCAAPEGVGRSYGAEGDLFTAPYALLNLCTGNSCTLEVPYISPTPNASTDFLHAPWVFFVSVLTPLMAPTGSPQTLQVNLYVTPLNSSFHGLRYPVRQHIKVRNVPGHGAFGTAVAGQEMPLVGVDAARPDSGYLPARPTNWLEFAGRPGLLASLTWTMADEPATRLQSLPISPDALASTTTGIGFVLTLFSQWQGEVKAQLLFTGSAQHYGRLVVAYTPPASRPPANLDEAMHGTYEVWDVNGSSTLDFTIPFMSQSYWKTVDIGTPDGLLSNNGYLSVFVMNPLTGPSSSPPSATIQAFVMAGDTFNVRFQQSPALGWQAADEGETEAAVSSMEQSQPTGDLGEQTTMTYHQTDLHPDTILKNYFSFFRTLALKEGGGPLLMQAGSVQLFPLDPMTMFKSDVTVLLSSFTYFVADLRINLRVVTNISASTTLSVGLIPAGATIPPGIENTTVATATMSNFTLIEQPLPATGSIELSLSLPYTSPQSALCTVYNGWESYDGKNYGHLHSNTFGTLVFYTVAPQLPGPPLPGTETISISAWYGFGDFQGFVPRPPPALGPLPSQSIANLNGAATFVRRAKDRTYARRQAAVHLDFGIEPEDRAFVVRVQRSTYVHWAIRHCRWDGKVSQISLQNVACQAVIGFETPEGDEVVECELDHWERACALVGSTYPYNAHHNCSTFIEDLTGYPCSNSGLSIGAGAALLGVAALAASAGVQTLKASRQGLGDLSSAAKVMTQTNVDAAFTVARDGIRVANVGSERLATAADRLYRASENVDFRRLENAANTLSDAARRVADSIDGARDTVENLSSVLQTPATSPFNSFFRWIAKFFGYLLIIFGSPTPMSIGGLLLVILADALPSVTEFFKKSGTVIGAAFYWVASKLGYNVDPAEAEQAAAEEPVAERQGVKDFNDTMTAMRHADWLLDKVLATMERLLRWLDKRAGDDPGKLVADNHDKILELYTDSITAVSSPPTTLDVQAVKHNKDVATKLLTASQKAHDQHHSVLLSQALRNYATVLGKNPGLNPGSRPEPLVVYIYGPPGCGKSLLASLIASTCAARLGSGPDDFYSPTSPDCEFFDGYSGQPVHFIDDIGQDPEGRDWAHFPNLVSTAPFIVPMASLEAKGTFYTSSLIVATSNFQGPNDRSARSLAALERRLHIRLKVTPEGVFDVDSALAACGPATRHFNHECPLTRLEACSVRQDPRSITPVTFTDLDDLVDAILDQVQVRRSHCTNFKGLIRQAGDPLPEPSPDEQIPSSQPPSGESFRVFRSTEDDFTRAAHRNAPVPVLESLWKYRVPIYYTAAFFTIVSSIIAIIYFARQVRSQSQGAYSALPVPKPRKPQPKPRSIPKSAAQRQGTLPPAIPKLAENLVPVTAYADDKALRSMSLFFLQGRWAVTASHLIHDATHIKVGDTMLSLSDLLYAVDGELMAINIPGREHRNVVRFLNPNSTFSSGFLISAVFNGTSYVRFSGVKQTPLDIEDVIVESRALVYSCSSFPGLCGAPVITADPSGCSIRGIHVAGVPGSSGMACELSPERWAAMLAATASRQSILEPIEPVGPPTHIQRSTALKPSPAYGAYPLSKEPAVLSRKDPRLYPTVDFDVQVYAKHNQGDITEPWPGLVEAFDLYFSPFPRKIRTLTMDEAINGTPNLDGIDMNQSPGYPWVSKGRSRRSLFTWEGDRWCPIPELVKEVEAVLSDPVYVYTTSLKDELRPLDKVRCGGTRLIEAAPIQAIIAGRMLLGGLFEYMQADPGSHGSAVGCNPDYHWTKFFWDFSSYDQVFDLDYKGFDATLPSICFKLLSQHLHRIIGDDRIPAYIDSISTSTHVFGSYFYRMVGGNPSGCVGTSIFNTIINNCCLISALMSHPDFSPTGYQILAYGDDVIYATEPSIHPRFVKEFYDEHTTLVVTPASKTGVFPEYSDIFDVTFLKRWFVPDDIRPMYVHPVIQPEVYQQSVMWLRGGEFQDVVTSLCYLAFHAGPINYGYWCSKVQEAAARVGVEPVFLPYSYLQLSWLKLVSA